MEHEPRNVKSSLRVFLFELLVYSVLVCGYFFLVLHFMGGWLESLFREQRRGYAVLSLLFIICQGFLLELLTRGLVRVFTPRKGS